MRSRCLRPIASRRIDKTRRDDSPSCRSASSVLAIGRTPVSFPAFSRLEPLMMFAFLTPTTLMILAALGVLVFGRRMPELGRSLGQTLVEFKKGMHGVEDELR